MDKNTPLDEDLVYVPIEVKSSTFKFYEGRKKVKVMKDDLFEEFEKFMRDMGGDKIVINHASELIRVSGIDFEPIFDLKKRHKLPSKKYSFVRVY